MKVIDIINREIERIQAEKEQALKDNEAIYKKAQERHSKIHADFLKNLEKELEEMGV